MKCDKRLSLRSLCPTVSQLFAETFHAPLQSFVWRRHIGAPFQCTNMAAGNQQKNLEFIFYIKALSFFFQHTCAKTYLLILEMVILLKINRSDVFHRDSIPIFVSRTLKTRKFKLLYFRNETCYGIGSLQKDLCFIYLQPSVNKNS